MAGAGLGGGGESKGVHPVRQAVVVGFAVQAVIANAAGQPVVAGAGLPRHSNLHERLATGNGPWADYPRRARTLTAARGWLKNAGVAEDQIFVQPPAPPSATQPAAPSSCRSAPAAA